MTHLSLHVDTITVGNVWEVFHRMIPYIQDHFCNFPPPSFDDIGTHVNENSSSHDSE
jgi:hypothetical protein